VTALCTFGLTVVVARGLSRADAGVFFSVTSLFLIASTVGQLGTQTGLVYFLARCRALGRPEAMTAYLRAALRPVVIVGVAMMVGLLVLAQPLATITAPHHVGQATSYLRTLAIFIPIAGLEAAALSATRGLGSMVPNMVIEQIARPLAQLALVGIAVAMAVSATWLGIAWSVAYLPAAVAAWLAWRARQRKYPRANRAEQAAVGRELWRFSLPRSLTSIIQMLMQRFDIVLVGALSSATSAAVYAAATRFIVLGQLGVNALTLASQPQFAARLATRDREAVNELYQVSTGWLILVTWPIYLTLIVFAKPALLVFGHGYFAGQTVIVLIASSMLLATGLGMVDTVLAMAGHTSWNLGNAALALGTNIGLDLWLIPRHGIVGAAIGWAAAIGVRNVAAALQVGFNLKFHPLARASVAAALLTLTCFAGTLTGARLALGDSVTALLSGLLGAMCCYVGGLWALRVPLRLNTLRGLRRRVSGG
jgi:O-antigen/teichoic acid export membrane protein